MELASARASLDFLVGSSDFVELTEASGFQIDLRYNSLNNFVGNDLYGEFNKAFLHRLAAEKIFKAQALLKSRNVDFKFIIFDALRPRSIQRVLWSHVVGTVNERYIANPDLGSLHNFGFAVDLSILDARGAELDMGAGFDDFRAIAQPQLEEKFLAEGLLTETHIANRKILRDALEGAGFKQLPHEWWHFDALPKSEVRASFQIVE